MIGFKFWLGKVAKTWRQLLVTGGTVLALGACGPGLDSLAPFSIGGTVSGLTGTLVLQNNGGDNLSLTGNGNFIFKTELANASAYVVTVLTQPVDQFCTVNGGTGAATGDVTTVAVQCTWTGTKQFGATRKHIWLFSSHRYKWECFCRWYDDRHHGKQFRYCWRDIPLRYQI